MDLDPKTWWYVTRASGFVAWALLAIAVLWGLFITNKTLTKSTAPAWVLDLHRHLGGLAVVFVAIHVGVLPLDGFTHWTWQDLAVPMHSPWHPAAIAWGIVSMYLLLAIEVTSLLGRRFPKKWWRRVHVLSFPLYVLASIHLFAAGTDAGNPIARWMVVMTSTLVAFLAGVRGLAAAKPRETGRSSRVPAPARAAAASAPAASAMVGTPEAVSPAAAGAPDVPVPVPVAAVAAVPPVGRYPGFGFGDLLPPKTARSLPGASARTATGVPAGESDPGGVMPAGTGPCRGLHPPTIEERAERIRAQSRGAAERARAGSEQTDRIPASVREAVAAQRRAE